MQTKGNYSQEMDNVMSDKKKTQYRITEVKAASEIRAKALKVEEFEGTAPEDEEAKRRIIEENVIDEVEPKSGS